jgi:hypothetical protein
LTALLFFDHFEASYTRLPADPAIASRMCMQARDHHRAGTAGAPTTDLIWKSFSVVSYVPLSVLNDFPEA